jgi:O-antigen/teichoic acid export membrane protein
MTTALSPRRVAIPIAGFFLVKIASGLLLLKLSAALLGVNDFAIFAQFLFLGALASTIAVGGAQNGVVREVAAGDETRVRRAGSAAFALWGVTLFVVAIISIGLAKQISIALTDSAAYAWAVPAVALAAIASGPSQILCAVLTGLGRTRASLLAQGGGVFIGTIAAAVTIAIYKTPAGAALAFYAGSLVSAAVAMIAVRGLTILERFPRAVIRAEIALLLRYSGGFVGIAVTTMCTMFALRYVYLGAFGQGALSFWLVAQRISDLSTQLMGLFMSQLVVPSFASAQAEERRALLIRYWVGVTGLMVVVFLVFAALPQLWVRLFLSSSYLAAIPMILVYMLGDIARATVSLAMHAALARKHILVYAGLEVAAIAVMAALTLTLVALREPFAPMAGYALGYLSVAICCLLWWLRRYRGQDRQQAPR